MTPPVYFNGRFLSQTLTGVQRFAREIVASFDRLQQAEASGPAVVLAPPSPPQTSTYRALPVRMVGRLRGHAWEQFELPFHARDGLLVNLGNSAPILGRRQLVVIHDAGVFAHPEAYSRPYRLFHKGLEHLLARSGAAIATVSRFSRDEIAGHLGLPPADIELLSEGADHILRTPPDAAIIERHGLAPGRYVLAVGSLVAHKNLSSLHAVAHMLERRGLQLAIAGGIALRVFDGDAVVLPQPATYLDRVSDGALRALYENAACFVFPSRYEGFGIPPVEAMACGCPVVAARAGAVMEVCGDAALYCDPDDPLDIAASVARFLDDPKLADQMRRRGRDQVRNLTWDNAAAALVRIIERLQARQRT